MQHNTTIHKNKDRKNEDNNKNVGYKNNYTTRKLDPGDWDERQLHINWQKRYSKTYNNNDLKFSYKEN